ncbi:hypothetical protein AX14_012280 [Amanita brunnescens Koide BX004]|nr:hypothetical protein AX14_012280 [Amanita brunnescens Koide BX004]
MKAPVHANAWPTAEEEKLKLLKYAQEAVARTQGHNKVPPRNDISKETHLPPDDCSDGEMDMDAYDNDLRISPKMGTPSETGMSLTQAQNPGLESDSAIDAPPDYIPPSAGPTEAARPNVVELVKKFQDFLPAQGVLDLAKTALSPHPVVSESGQEQEHTLPVHRGTTVWTKTRHQISRDNFASDYYAESFAPKYLTRSPLPGGAAEPNGTSEREKSRAPLSSSLSPSKSLHEMLQSLLVTLTELRAVRGPLVNDDTLLLFRELLYIPDATIASGVESTNSDVELFLEFLLYVLRDGSLQVEDISRDLKKRARKLMFKLVSKANILPRPLFITDIEKDPQAVAVGGFGRVFKGKYSGQLVALKMLYHSRRPGDSIDKSLYTEALAWKSLSHRFILPLLGIYEEGPQLFLVSPFMTNGVLRDWRKDHVPVRIDEVRRLLLEVAEGVQYIHSEGIIHGDLHGGNVLLDAEFHCQITDFGSTRHCDVTATRSTTTLSFHFAAPELFGMCATCGELDCEELHDGDEEQHKMKTKKTDVYAFGCLYYAIFFDTVPFHGKSDIQILRLITKGVHPVRLKNPIMEEHIWNLVHGCWKSIPSERPTMEQIVIALTPAA